MTWWMHTHRSDAHPKRSNIMILVLFVMFIVSVFGLLVSQYVVNLINISSLFHQYYNSYYYAYGGLEFGLTLVKNHGFGYQENITYNTFDNCNRDNCQFDLHIISRTRTLIDNTNAHTESPENVTCDRNEERPYFALSSGDALIVPLFWDSTTGFNYDANDPDSFSTIAGGPPGGGGTGDDIHDFRPHIFTSPTSSGDSYIIRIIDEDTENYNVTLTPQASASGYNLAAALGTGIGYVGDQNNKNYLIIANAVSPEIDFCIEATPDDPDSGVGLYLKWVIVDSRATYGDATASLRAAKSNPLPSFLAYGTLQPPED